MIDMQYTEEEIREEEEEEKIQTAEVYTGEIGPNDNYPEAIIININENKPKGFLTNIKGFFSSVTDGASKGISHIGEGIGNLFENTGELIGEGTTNISTSVKDAGLILSKTIRK